MNIKFLIILTVTAAGVMGVARSRGGNLAIWAPLPMAGIPLMWWLAPVIGGPMDLSDRQAFWFFLSILWMGGCFFCARFLVGRSRETPGEKWVCRASANI